MDPPSLDRVRGFTKPDQLEALRSSLFAGGLHAELIGGGSEATRRANTSACNELNEAVSHL